MAKEKHLFFKIVIFTAVLLGTMTFLSRTASANDMDFVVKDGELVKYEGTDKIVEIPNTVTSIGSKAFASSAMEEVKIPETVTSIGDNAFSSCYKLKSVCGLNKVISIGDSAFENCWDLKTVNGLTAEVSVGDYAFYSTHWLKEKSQENPMVIVGRSLIDGTNCKGNIIIPDNVDRISSEAFLYSQIESVVVPESVTKIGEEAFHGCKSLKKINIPKSVTEIKEMTFYETQIESVVIPDSVTKIGDSAFFACKNLQEIIIPDSVTEIEDRAFGACNKLKDIDIPTGVHIGSRVFEETKWLEQKQKENPFVIVNNILIDGKKCTGDIVIPDNVTGIGGHAFSNSQIKSVVIPDSVTAVGETAFGYCKSLKSVRLPEKLKEIGESAFIENPITQIAIPDSVESIGTYAFYSCTKLTNVKLSSSLSVLPAEIFNKCSSLRNITIPGNITEIAQNSFDTAGKKTLYSIKNSFTQEYVKQYGTKINAKFKELALSAKSLSLTVKNSGKVSMNSGVVPRWSSSNKSVATVDKNGKVVAKKKGTAKITGSIYGKKFVCNVKVK